MKLKSILAVGVLMSAFASIDARADCKLEIYPSSYIQLGQTFYFVVELWDGFGPPAPPPPPQFTIRFFGTKNGVVDIPATGEGYPGSFSYGRHTLPGFANPESGVYSGNYTRYLAIYNQLGQVWCVTNTLAVTLQ